MSAPLATGTPLVRARAVSRRFGATTALAGVDLAICAGEAVALLGPNGSGKTTLLSIMAGVTRAGDGEVVQATTDDRLGWVPHDPSVYRRLTARENLRLFTALEGRADPKAVTERLLEHADLVEVADRRAAELSTGTLQRLNLAIALAGEPSVLLLDEPTATLSPEQRHRLWRWLDELRTVDGLAVLFSTQSVEEARLHADRLAILAEGRLVFDGSIDALIAAHGTQGVADPVEAAFLRLVDAEPA